jgi:hypothetical protein
VAFADRGLKSLITFAALNAPGRVALLVDALRPLARHRRGRVLRVETIDGLPARQAPLADALREAGFASDHKGLLLEAG